MKFRFTPSHAAFTFVLLVAGGSFAWWARSRPSFLLFQAHSRLGHADQAAVIHEYRRLLSAKNLPKEKEIQFRKALGEFYVRAIQEGTSISIYYRDKSQVDHPYLKEAKKEFERILELDPNDSQAHYYQGRIFLFQRMEAFAMEELEKSRALGPQFPEPATFLSLIHQERGDGSKARDMAVQALAIAPTNDEARMALVSSYAVLGEHEKAFEEYDSLSPAYRRIPLTRARHASYLAEQNHWDQAVAEMQSASEDQPDNGWIRVLHAQLLLEQEQAEKAGGELAQAQALMPRNIWPMVTGVQVWSALGSCKETGRASQYLMEGFPRWPWAHFAGAFHHLCQGHALNALASLDEALRLSPEFFEATQLKARILADKGQFDELGRLLRPLLDKKIHESFGYAALAQSLHDQGNPDLALASAEQAISADQRNPWGFVWLAFARLELGMKDAAVRALEEGVRLRPFDSSLRAYEALFWVGAGDTARAEKILQKYIQERSRNPYVWTILGILEESRDHTPEAVTAYSRALELRPYLLGAHLGLISIYANSGDREKASAQLKKAFEINPKHKAVLAWRQKI